MPLPPTPYPVCHIEFEGQSVLSSDIRSLDLLTNVSWQADQLTLVLDNARLLSDFIRKEQGVECWLGYAADPYLWDKSELAHVFSGAVDGVLPSFGQDTTLTVMCRDHTRELIDSQADPGWSYMSLADAGIVTLLAKRAGLTPKVSPSMVPISEQEVTSFLGGGYLQHPMVGMSGWDIVQELAVRNGFVAYVTVDKVLYWGPRNDHPASIGTWTYLEEPFDLLAANFEDSVLVINKVTVVRWLGLDQVQPDGFVSGFAVDAGRIAAMRGRINEKTVASTTATSVQDCEAEAAALLKKLARPAIICTATVEGDPRLIGDAKLTLAGRVGRFKGDYYIEGAKHHFGTDGYTCALELTSVRPEASEAYRSALNVGPQDAEAAAALQPAVGSVPTCTGAPVDWAAEWPEFGPGGGPSAQIAALLTANNLPAATGTAACGPIAAAGMLKAYGITTDPGKLAKRGEQGDAQGAWWTPGGQAGPDSLVKLLASQGLKAKNLGRDIQEAIRRCSRCEPVIFDTAGTGGNVGHYILASAYDPARGFFGGVTISNAMAASHHNPWATVAEIESYRLGSIRSVIVADVAAAPAQRAADVTNLPPMQVDGRSHQAFVDSSKPLAYAWEKQTGIPAVVFMAISASESNWGGAAKPPTVMLFGIGADGAHPSVTFSDNPYMAFRAYPDANGAYADFVGLVTQGRYATAYARVKAGGSGEQFVADLQSAGYAGHHNASDEDWTNIITSLMRQVEALL